MCMLERSAVLSLCKLCCVSAEICAQNLDLLFGLCKSNAEFGLKANIIIALADLFNRYPNLMNERVQDVFALLGDRQVYVR